MNIKNFFYTSEHRINWGGLIKILVSAVIIIVLFIVVYTVGYNQASLITKSGTDVNVAPPTPTYAKYLPNRKGYAHD